jgi:hypothetical protein
MRCLVVVLLVSCVDEPPAVTEPTVTSYVVRRELPLSAPLPSLSLASPCFEQTIPEPFDCAAWFDDGDLETVIPPCDDTGTCWRIVEDPMSCFDASHQAIELAQFEPRSTMLIMECLVRVL